MKKSISRKNVLKEAGTLLIAAILILTAIFVLTPINKVTKALPPDQIPTANFTYSPEDPKNTTIIHFTDTSTDLDGSIVSWWWNFGDHYYSDLQNPIHCYYVNGLYNVNLIVTDNDGFTNNVIKMIIIDNPPSIPSNPDPYDNKANVNTDYKLSWTGGDIDNDPVTYDVYFGDTSPPPKVQSNQSGTTYDPGILKDDTTYYWMIVAWDIYGMMNSGPVWTFSTKGNNPPNPPTKPSGQTICWVNKLYYYSTKSADPDGDQLYYKWFWGDGNTSDWIGPYDSNIVVSASHTWTKKGMYHVMVKAKDIHGAESYWSSDRLVYVIY